jgi:hypothetical protein
MKLEFMIMRYASSSHFEPKNRVTARLLDADDEGVSASERLRILFQEIYQVPLIPSLYVVGRGCAFVTWNDDQDMAHISGLDDGRMLRLFGSSVVWWEDQDGQAKLDKKELTRLEALRESRIVGLARRR